MLQKRTIPVLAATALAAIAAGAASAQAPGSASLVIRHQLRGCHAWALNGSAFKAAQTLTLRAGASITVTNNDVMPHKLVETSGPKVVPTGANMNHMGAMTMNHMGATSKITFSHKGVYVFTTKAGEDYMKGVKTIGEDNVLRLKVTVA